MSNFEVTQRNPIDAEDDGIQYFHSAYCSIPLQPLMAYISQPKPLAIYGYCCQHSLEQNG
jgi:hypothetical protein